MVNVDYQYGIRDYFIFLCCILSGLFFYSPLAYVFTIIAIISLLAKRKINIRNDFLLLIIVLYSISYLVMGFMLGSFSIVSSIKNSMVPLLFCLAINTIEGSKYDYVRHILASYSAGFLLTFFLSTLNYNRLVYYPVKIFWDGSDYHPVNMNMYSLISVALIYWGVFFVTQKKYKALYLLMGGVGIYLSFRISKYTTLFVAFIVFFLNLIAFKRRRSLTVVAIMIIGISIFLKFYGLENLDIVNRALTDLSPRDSLGQRVLSWGVYFPDMFFHPFDGRSIKNPYLHWAHNLFLDVYIENGIFTMILLIVIYIMHFKDIVSMLYSNVVLSAEKCYWASISLALFLGFFTEPAYDANPLLVNLMFIIVSSVRCRLYDVETDEIKLDVDYMTKKLMR